MIVCFCTAVIVAGIIARSPDIVIVEIIYRFRFKSVVVLALVFGFRVIVSRRGDVVLESVVVSVGCRLGEIVVSSAVFNFVSEITAVAVNFVAVTIVTGLHHHVLVEVGTGIASEIFSSVVFAIVARGIESFTIAEIISMSVVAVTLAHASVGTKSHAAIRIMLRTFVPTDSAIHIIYGGTVEIEKSAIVIVVGGHYANP